MAKKKAEVVNIPRDSYTVHLEERRAKQISNDSSHVKAEPVEEVTESKVVE